MYVCMCVYACMNVYIYIYVFNECMCVCMYEYIYIYIYIYMYNGFYANYKKNFRSIWLHGQLLIEPLLTPVDELLSKEHSDEVKTLVYIYTYVCMCVYACMNIYIYICI